MSFADLVQPFKIEALGLRGRLVRLGPALDAILGAHAYPRAVAEMLGESLALAAVLANALKFDGTFKLQTQGDGPLPLIVADVTSGGGVRGYARFDADRLKSVAYPSAAPVPRLLGAGRFAVTVDRGPGALSYQGITELTGPRLADCAHTYFRQSEPLETAIALAAAPANGAGATSAALMIQRLAPDADVAVFDAEDADEDWRRAVILTSSVTAAEMLDAALAPAELLYRLYHEDGVRLYRTRPLRHACGCSADKVAATLGSFGPDDIASMVEDGRIIVTCEFCKRAYTFEGDSLAALYAP